MAAGLTIGIPTFNGSAYIEEAIESVLSQLSPDTQGRVDVLVSDNASSDDTSEIVSKCAQRHPTLVALRRNEANIGYDANVDAIFRSARGEYVHILGDDDFLMPGALAHTLHVIDENPDVAVIVGQVSFLDIAKNVVVAKKEYEADALCEGDSFFRLTEWGTAAVSSLIIRRTGWLGQDLARYVGSQWIHVAAVMKMLADDVPAYVMARDLVTVRVGNPRWGTSNGNQLYLGMKHLEVLSEMNRLGYQPDVFAFYLTDRYATNRRDIRSLRAHRSWDNIPTASLMVRFFRDKPAVWLFDLPLLLLPPALLAIPRAIRRSPRILRAIVTRLRSAPAGPPR